MVSISVTGLPDVGTRKVVRFAVGGTLRAATYWGFAVKGICTEWGTLGERERGADDGERVG